MSKHRKRNFLLPGVLLLAATGAFLRQRLYAVGLDEKNLLVDGHPLEMALWLCTALAAAGICFVTCRERERHRQQTLLSALGHIMAASGILLAVLPVGSYAAGPIAAIWKYEGVVSAAMLLACSFALALGKRPFFGTYAMVSVFFALHLVNHYQSWCADPQLQNYVFSFAAAMALMLFGYYHAAAAAGNGNCRGLRISGLLAVYFCIVAASGLQQMYLYLGCGIWALTSLCPPPKEGEADASS